MDSPPADRGKQKSASRPKPEGGKPRVKLAAMSSGTTPGLKRAIGTRREVPEASRRATPPASSVAPKPRPSSQAKARDVTLPAYDGLVAGLIVLWFLALLTRPFDKPMVLAVVYSGLVFGGGRYGEFPTVETLLVTGISLVLGLAFFWILHKARRSNQRWVFIFLFGPVAIEGLWVLPGFLVG